MRFAVYNPSPVTAFENCSIISGPYHEKAFENLDENKDGIISQSRWIGTLEA